jgi:hypothetical protein
MRYGGACTVLIQTLTLSCSSSSRPLFTDPMNQKHTRCVPVHANKCGSVLYHCQYPIVRPILCFISVKNVHVQTSIIGQLQRHRSLVKLHIYYVIHLNPEIYITNWGGGGHD